jgi:hypothetical protein
MAKAVGRQAEIVIRRYDGEGGRQVSVPIPAQRRGNR